MKCRYIKHNKKNKNDYEVKENVLGNIDIILLIYYYCIYGSDTTSGWIFKKICNGVNFNVSNDK